MVRALTTALLVFTSGNQASEAPVAEEVACVRLSGTQIGQLPLVVNVGGQKVEFVEWKATDITAQSLVGFTAQAPREVRFTVQAGTETFDTTANWLHPLGVVGPRAHRISALTVCAR